MEVERVMIKNSNAQHALKLSPKIEDSAATNEGEADVRVQWGRIRSGKGRSSHR